MAYKAVIFDLDGTLLDTLEDLHASVTAALEANGMPARSVDEVRAALGFGARELIRRCVPAGTPDAEQERAYASFKRHYLANSSAHTRPYPGIPLLVRILSQEGVQRAIVSNKPDAAVQDLAAQYFCGSFNAVAGEREGIRRKPAPDTVLSVMERLDLEPASTVYVGDSEVDIETAANAGLDCVSVSWGFRTREQLKGFGATRIADTCEQLAEMLLL